MISANTVSTLEVVKIISRFQAEHFLQMGAIFIDNRPEYKFSIGHIEGAINLPYFIANDPENRMSKNDLIQAIGENKIVIFYCSGRKRAYHALKQAQQWGLTAEMYWYRNGFEEWELFHPLYVD